MNKEQKIAEFIRVLGGQRNGAGAMCCCPAHDDKNPSLSVNFSEGGKMLVHCHAKCPQEIVIFKLVEKGLWGNDIPKPRTVLSTNEWIYDDENFQPTLKVTRYINSKGKKQYSLSSFKDGIWVSGKSETNIVPYRYKEWDLSYNKYVFIVEGEKCADFLYLSYLNSTTSPMGAGKWPKHFGPFFKDHHIVILPDNDEPGKKHAQLVLENIKPFAKSIRLVQLPNLGEAEDVVDYFQKPNSSKENFLKLIEAVEPIVRTESATSDNHLDPLIWSSPRPYKEENDLLPIFEKKELKKILPTLLFSWFDDISKRLNVPLEVVSTIGLSVMCGAIGTRIYFKPKERDNWRIYPCSFWCLIVALPGSKKTPILFELYLPLKKIDDLFDGEYLKKLKENEPTLQILKIRKDGILLNIKNLQKEDNQTEIAKCREHLASVLAQEKDLKVPRRRITTSSTTVSKLIEILADNPAGIVFNKDELKGLFDSFFIKGNERLRSILLEGWSGTGQITDDTLSNGTRKVKRCALTVIGSIQPAPLSSFISKSDDGFIERFGGAVALLQQPFTDDLDSVFDERIHKEIENMFIEISNISIDTEYFCRMNDDAKVLFNSFRKEFYDLKLSPSANSKIVTHISKYETLFGCLCVVWSLAQAYDQQKLIPSELIVDKEIASNVIKWITDILYPHAKYIYDNTITNHSVRVLVEKILNKKVKDGDSIRTIAHNEWSGLRNSDSVLAACEKLEKLNWLKIEERKSSKGGRTSLVARINPQLNIEDPHAEK